MSKFLQNKTCIYLDQFAVSKLFEDEAWNEILKLIEGGIRKDLILIPYSIEHLMESSKKDFQRAQRLDGLFFQLTNGIGLATEPEINTKLLISAIRNRKITSSVYLKQYSQNGFEFQNAYDRYRNLKTVFDQMIFEGTNISNEIRSITREKKQKTDFNNLEDSVGTTSENYQRELETRLKKYSNYGFFDRRPLQFSMMTIPFWADTVVDLLISDFKINSNEAKRGQLLLKKNGIKKIIPPLHIRTALETIMSIKQQHETANDHLDIVRLCSAVSFADIILTDKSKVFDLQTLKLDSHFKTELFSGSKQDLVRFIAKLKTIIN